LNFENEFPGTRELKNDAVNPKLPHVTQDASTKFRGQQYSDFSILFFFGHRETKNGNALSRRPIPLKDLADLQAHPISH
jgi:hypothetical protein